MDELCEDALEAAKGRAAATTGTAVHALTEAVDRGQELPAVPDAYLADLDAYRRATRALAKVHIEQMVVLDDLQVAGTPDRIVEYQGRHFIADVKTGSIEYGAGKIAMQLALYAHGRGYDVSTGERFDLPPVDQQRAIVIHLPAGTGECTLHWIDIARGWEAVDLAVRVRDWRKAKGLLSPCDVPVEQPEDGVMWRIHHATSVADLEATYSSAAQNGQWTDEHTAAAAARKAELTAAA